MTLLEIQDGSPYSRVLVTSPPVHSVPEASVISPIDPARYPPPTGELFIQEYAANSGDLRSALTINERDSRDPRPKIVDALAMRNLKILNYMRGRVNVSSLRGIESSITESELTPERIGETISNRAIDLSLSARSNERERVLQGIVDERVIDAVVMERFGISAEEIEERIPILEKSEDERRRKEWLASETIKMQAKARRIEEQREKEKRRMLREAEAIRQTRESLMRAGSSRRIIPVAS